MKQFESDESIEHKNFYINKLQPIRNALLKLYEHVEIDFNVDSNTAKICISHENLSAEALITGELINHAVPGRQYEIFKQIAHTLAVKLIETVDFTAAQKAENIDPLNPGQIKPDESSSGEGYLIYPDTADKIINEFITRKNH